MISTTFTTAIIIGIAIIVALATAFALTRK